MTIGREISGAAKGFHPGKQHFRVAIPGVKNDHLGLIEP
jgi:hypothetical protein